MNEQQIATVMASTEFQQSAMHIAGMLRISLQDAKAMLIEELWSHRHTLDTVGQTLTSREKAHINFGKKDILRSEWNQENATMKLFTGTTDDKGHSLIDDVPDTVKQAVSYSEGEIERALVATEHIMTANQFEFIEGVLTKGAEGYMTENHLSPKVFNQKMKRIEEQLADKHERLDKALQSDAELELRKNQQLAQGLYDMIMGDQDTPKQWIQKALLESLDNGYFDKLWDTAGIKHPRAMIMDWDDTTESRQDGYRFVTALEQMIEG